jgi:hypothetical protein
LLQSVIADCSALAPSDDINFATDCVEVSPVFPCEPVHGMIEKLPGCIIPTGYGVNVTSADNTWSVFPLIFHIS